MENPNEDLPRTVILIGAGASVAQARHHRSNGKGGAVEPPLDFSFFQRALEEDRRDREITGNIHHLREFIKQTNQYADPFDSASPSMEQFFADVYYEVVNKRSESDFRIYVELLKLYCNLIASTTNPMMLLPAGPVDSLLATEYESARGSIAVITFNHDLVIENALYRLLEQSGNWRSLQDLYGDIQLDEVSHSSGHRFPVSSGSDVNSGVKLLKLHGSLNWVISVTGEQPLLDELFPREMSNLLLLPDRLTEELGLLYIYKREQNVGQGRDLWPFVVPPIYEKTSLVGIEILQRLWTRARKYLAGAQRLILFGYSLPEGDHLAIQLLRSGIRRRPSLESVVCINTDAHVVARICSKLECRSVEFHQDTMGYIKRRSL